MKTKVGVGGVRPDVEVTRQSGTMMPHYANRLGKASDLSGLGLLKELAVISELKVGASTQDGLDMPSMIRDLDKLSLLLTEFKVMHLGSEVPLACACILDNHGRRSSTLTLCGGTAKPKHRGEAVDGFNRCENAHQPRDAHHALSRGT